MSFEPKKSHVNVVNKYTHVKISSAGAQGPRGFDTGTSGTSGTSGLGTDGSSGTSGLDGTYFGTSGTLRFQLHPFD